MLGVWLAEPVAPPVVEVEGEVVEGDCVVVVVVVVELLGVCDVEEDEVLGVCAGFVVSVVDGVELVLLELDGDCVVSGVEVVGVCVWFCVGCEL